MNVDSLMKAGDSHGTHFHIPPFSCVAERLHTSSNPVTGLYYGHLIDDHKSTSYFIFLTGNAAVKTMNLFHFMSGVLQKFCRRQSGNSSADDRNVSRSLGGGKSLLDDVEKLPVISVLQAVKQRISEDPTDGDHHHHADQDQRNWGRRTTTHNKTKKFRWMGFNWSQSQLI